MVADHYMEKWQDRYQRQMMWPQVVELLVSRQEFDELRREVAELKSLLARAKEYDERTGQADCESDEKMAVVRQVAKLVGINLDDVIGKPAE